MIARKIKLCLVSPVAPPYGGITHWTSLISQHAKNRSDISIHQINISPRWRSIHSRGLLIRSLGGALQLVWDCSKLVKSLIFNDFDVVHLTTSGQLAAIRDISLALIAKLFRVPLILHVRFGRIPSISVENTLEWRLIKCAILLSSRVLLIDRSSYAACKIQFPIEKLELIPNCVDTTSLSLLADKNEFSEVDSRVVLFLGWIIPQKGIEELLLSWDNLNLDGWRLDLIGPYDVNYLDYLRGKYKMDGVRLLGELPHSEAMSRLSSCDVFTLPSHTEGFPNVVVEAMAFGRPIIATDVGAIPEMMSDGVGWVVKAHDADALEAAMRELVSNPVLRSAYGNSAKKKAEDFYSIDSIFEKYMRVWSALKTTSDSRN